MERAPRGAGRYRCRAAAVLLSSTLLTFPLTQGAEAATGPLAESRLRLVGIAPANPIAVKSHAPIPRTRTQVHGSLIPVHRRADAPDGLVVSQVPASGGGFGSQRAAPLSPRRSVLSSFSGASGGRQTVTGRHGSLFRDNSRVIRGWTVSAIGELDTRYDNNVGGTEESGVIFRPGAEVSARAVRQGVSPFIEVDAGYEINSAESDRDGFIGELAAGADTQVTPSTEVGARAFIRRERQSRLQSGLDTVQLEQNEFTTYGLSLGAEADIARFSYSVRGGLSRRDPNRSGADTADTIDDLEVTQAELGAGLGFETPIGSQFFLDGTLTSRNFEGRLDNGSTARDQLVAQGLAGVRVYPSPLVDIELGLGVASRLEGGPDDGSDTEPVAVMRVNWFPSQFVNVQAGYRRRASFTDGDGQGLSRSDIFELKSDIELARPLFITPSFGFATTKDDGDDDRSEDIAYGLSLKYAATATLAIAASVRYVDQSSGGDDAADEFDRLQVGLSLSNRF
ncbi:MAG: outer membrane beta-barrel protein [Pseudomonadota bacterium]